ncbi:hypothetical protein PoB_003850200 [Plakobranchus ocellatus]|uniref:Uncharacterized protein n=1 Tax=Plakobranchus ocellatus TaxID=259542 RepID=A0AAV4AY56_9GAST|nr:hypothetical protein PoB_003850200 [Plakobranchus ocellatus]
MEYQIHSNSVPELGIKIKRVHNSMGYPIHSNSVPELGIKIKRVHNGMGYQIHLNSVPELGIKMKRVHNSMEYPIHSNSMPELRTKIKRELSHNLCCRTHGNSVTAPEDFVRGLLGPSARAVTIHFSAFEQDMRNRFFLFPAKTTGSRRRPSVSRSVRKEERM